MNHKIIELKSPFQNLGEYLKFAKQLLDKDIEFTKRFQKNLEQQYSRSYSIAQLKTCLLHNLRSKQKSNIDYRSNESYWNGKDQKVSIICKYLTNLEICILFLAAKLVHKREQEQFNINLLSGLLKEIPSQMSCNKKLLYMATGVLIDYRLFVIKEKRTLQAKKPYLTEWTPLVFNVFKCELEAALKILKIPTEVQQLLQIKNA